MEIRFQTKEQSNKRQQLAFLNLSGAERLKSFLHLMEQVNRFPTKHIKKRTNNYLIVLPNQNELGG